MPDAEVIYFRRYHLLAWVGSAPLPVVRPQVKYWVVFQSRVVQIECRIVGKHPTDTHAHCGRYQDNVDEGGMAHFMGHQHRMTRLQVTGLPLTNLNEVDLDG
eukprot:1066176-Prorocentrum_minimum.AAC.1